ncbi:hypothetical protein ELI00_04075 [Rhizobium ruizarguesonis]|nr:hypothetical protein ELI00_04075 [Rhizobium ruizarguesonis]TAZ93774.1 hypothetical protein ELH67_03955 [Rhizobium ruizarguesonis]TBA36676.1 hypothetical protein ELH60_04005 [Rhizobium ruizarguesonis]TBC62010.1 hypothetical protein ELH36_04000 [Rhizobium ruizarguesonis]
MRQPLRSHWPHDGRDQWLDPGKARADPGPALCNPGQRQAGQALIYITRGVKIATPKHRRSD